MKALLLLAVVMLGFAAARGGAAEPQHKYYVQFVRSSNNPKPENPEWKKVGPRLSRTLSPVFRWEHYWEVSRRTVNVGPGKVTRVPLEPQREVRLRIIAGERIEAQYFWKGEMHRKVVRPIDGEMIIVGGDLENKDGWFVVVRRDKPTLE